jgi:hypothetical protein
MARNDRGPMAGRTMLVTGATSGIGKATAVALAAMGPDRTEAATNGGQTTSERGQGPFRIFPDSAPELRFPAVGLTGFGNATP